MAHGATPLNPRATRYWCRHGKLSPHQSGETLDGRGIQPDLERKMKERPNMAVPFLQRIIANLCPHRFSWPHSGPHGQDYQVCLICGTAYEFDVVEMRRTGRVFHPPEETGQQLGNPSR